MFEKTIRVAFVMLLALAITSQAFAQPRRSRSRLRSSGFDVVDIRMHSAGELEDRIPDELYRSVRVLYVSGPINGRDLAFMKKIAQRSNVYDINDRKVDNYLDLDIEDAYIESGGGGFFSSTRSSRDEIPSSCFSGCSHLRTVILPARLGGIGSYAFSNCSNLEEAVIGQRVTSIDDNAFYGCSRLKYLYMGDYVESLGNSAFEDCSSLTEVWLPRSLRSMGKKCFRNVPVTRLELPRSLEFMGEGALGGTKLTELYIPAALEIERANAGHLPRLKAYVVENGSRLYYARDGVLYDAAAITLLSCPPALGGALDVPEGVTSIAAYAFYGCTALSDVTLPSTVTRLGKGCFSASGLRSFDMPEGVSVLPDEALKECKSLRRVVLHDDVTSIGSHAMSNCEGLTSIEMPSTLASIGEYAFYRCYSIAEVTVPEGVTELPQSAFQDCTALTAITFHDRFRTLGKECLRNCKSLYGIDLPESLVAIGKEAFRDCKALAAIDIPEGVRTIGDNAFRSTALTELTLPSTVTNIGKKITEKCKLRRINCLAALPPVLEKENDSKVPLFVPAASVEAYKSAKQWKNFKQINPL